MQVFIVYPADGAPSNSVHTLSMSQQRTGAESPKSRLRSTGAFIGLKRKEHKKIRRILAKIGKTISLKILRISPPLNGAI